MYSYNRTGGQQDRMKIWDVLDRASSGTGGPTPMLTNAGEFTWIYQEQLGFIEFGSSEQPIKAIPLLTCASLVVASTHAGPGMKGAVYHALAGSLPDAILSSIHATLEYAPLNSLLALYVFPNPMDDDYQRDLNKLVSFGIPTNNVVYMDNFPYNRFGINKLAEVGF